MTFPRTYYAQTMPGVERIAWLEIRQRLPHVRFAEFFFVKDQNGIVAFEWDGDANRLFELRTTEDVFALVASAKKLSRDWKDLRTVARLIEQSASLNGAVKLLPGARGRRVTYRVVSRKVGRHQYRRIDLQSAVVKGIQRRYGSKWRLVDDGARVEIWANVIGSRLLCGLRLSDQSMRHRAYQRVHLPASLRPSVAAAMVWLTDPAPQDVFLEPMCGSGTIMAERVLGGSYRRVLGGDILWDRARASARNLGSIGKPFTVCTWRACRLPLASGSVDAVSVNLPFGKQVGSRAEIEKLYPCFFAELERVLKPEGRAVVLSSEYELVKDVIRRHRRLLNVTGYSVAVLGQWARIYVLKKFGRST